MRELIQFLLIGLVSGVIYGLIALGLVLVYKGSRAFNFAQAEFGTAAMYILYLAAEIMNLPYVIALLMALTAAVLFGVATERFIVRPLGDAPKVIVLVATAGAALLSIGLQFWIARPEPRDVPGIFSEGGGTQFFGLFVTPDQFLQILVLAVVGVATALFFKRTYLGMAILANSQDSFATQIVGASTKRISALTWGLAGLLGGIAGILLAPTISLVPGYMTTNLLVFSFAAAVIGGMTSLVGAFVGGSIIGVIQGFAQYVFFELNFQVIPELAVVIIFLVLILTLVISPKGIFGAEA